MLEVTEREQVSELEDIPALPTPVDPTGFLAPVRITSSLKPKQIEFLMIHDSDPFNRWQAAQTYATNLIASAARNGLDLEPVSGTQAGRLAQALEPTLRDETLAPTYRAETLKLPSESDIARELGRDVDTDAILMARDTLRTTLSTALAATLTEIYEGSATDGAFSPDPDSAGRRALRNAALDLMSATGTPEAVERALRHYRGATNMTDAIMALSVLSQIPSPARDEALEHFYARWQDDPLVLDKWFAVQARAARPDSVETVQALLGHPKFSLKNPNRVRALIGSFAMANPSGFNRADGAGFRFLADQALEIDGFNPHVSARLLGAFESWKTLESGRQAHAKAALETLAGQKLSTDAYEIVTKTLGSA